jgi:hypothetical protein
MSGRNKDRDELLDRIAAIETIIDNECGPAPVWACACCNVLDRIRTLVADRTTKVESTFGDVETQGKP